MDNIQDTKIKTRLEVVNNEVESETAELYLYGTIRKGYWWEGEDDEYISAKKVQNLLKGLNGKKVNVHINSGGGDIFESVAISNLLKQYSGDLTIIIDSLAGSGASIIANCGRKVLMFNNSMQMIHKAWTYGAGNSDDFRKLADDLDKIDTAVKASYKARFVGTDEELEELVKAESWLTAEECLAFGFCDEIIEGKVEEETVENNIKETLFNKYSKNINSSTTKTVGGNNPTLFNGFMKK